MKFLKGWLPKKGDRITASLTFKNWTKEGADKKLSCGDFLLDEMKMTGGPLVATLGGISIPTNSAIKSTNRTKTWKKVSIKQIAQEIAKRYGLKLIFDGPNYTIKSIEQTDKSDSSFLYDLCKDYGLGMKVYKNKIVIWGKSKHEGKKATATIKRADFIHNQDLRFIYCFPLGCLYISSDAGTIQVIYNRKLHKDLGRFLVVIMTFQPGIHSQARAHIQRSLNDQRSPLSVRNIDTKYRSQDTREAAHDDHNTLSRTQDHGRSACTAGAF